MFLYLHKPNNTNKSNGWWFPIYVFAELNLINDYSNKVIVYINTNNTKIMIAVKLSNVSNYEFAGIIQTFTLVKPF